MEKKNTYSKWMAVVLLACVCGLVSCRAEYEVTKVEGTRVAMDATWDAEPDKDALALLEPYKAGVDSVMGEVKGVAAVSMDRFRPESPLSNLIADVLRQPAPVSRGSHAPRPFHGLRGARDGCRTEDRGAHRRPCGDEEMNNVNSRKKGLSQ